MNEYIQSAVNRTARPRSKRLRQLGGIVSPGLVSQESDNYLTGETHSHLNLADLSMITVADGYLYLTDTYDDDGSLVTETVKAKAGYADQALSNAEGHELNWFIPLEVGGVMTLKLNPIYAGLWAEGWIGDGGIGQSGGSGGGSSVSWGTKIENTRALTVDGVTETLLLDGALSSYYTKQEVQGLIGAINQFHYEVYASTAAVTSPSANVLYLIGPTGAGFDKYKEYVYANNDWVPIGDTSLDLAGYALLTDLPTALSQLSGDSTHRLVTDTQISAWNAKSNFSGSYNDLSDKPSIPNESTVSGWGFTKNAGTVTSVAMTLPTGLSVSGSPITASGTFAVSFATGYSIPTTAKQGNWDAAYSTLTGSQTRNYVLAAPASANGAPSFRKLVASDIPDLSATYVTLSGAQTISGAKTFSAAVTLSGVNLLPASDNSCSLGTGGEGGKRFNSAHIRNIFTSYFEFRDGTTQAKTGGIGFDGNLGNIVVTKSGVDYNYVFYAPNSDGNGFFFKPPTGQTQHVPLGKSDHRWTEIWGVEGNFSGALTLSGTTNATRRIYFGDTSHYIELENIGTTLSPDYVFHFSRPIYTDGWIGDGGIGQSGGSGGSSVAWGTVSGSTVQLTVDGVTKTLLMNGALSGYALSSSIPTALSQLSGDSTHRLVTDTQISAWTAKSNFSGSYNDLSDKPSIPNESTVSGWGFTKNAGTVTSVSMTLPTGLSVSGSPITASGTFAVSFATGYSIPTTAKQGNWDTAYSTLTGSQTRNYVLAAPASANGAPSFRKLVASDIPDLSATYLTSHQAVTLASGTANGTLKITTAAGTTDNIAVKGLGSLAYKSSLVANDIPDMSGTYVTLSGAQTISGIKTFDSNSVILDGVGIVPKSDAVTGQQTGLGWLGTNNKRFRYAYIRDIYTSYFSFIDGETSTRYGGIGYTSGAGWLSVIDQNNGASYSYAFFANSSSNGFFYNQPEGAICVPLGKSDHRWSVIYGTNGDLSGNLTVGGNLTLPSNSHIDIGEGRIEYDSTNHAFHFTKASGNHDVGAYADGFLADGGIGTGTTNMKYVTCTAQQYANISPKDNGTVYVVNDGAYIYIGSALIYSEN